MFRPKQTASNKRPLSIVQSNFKKGTITFASDSRIPNDGLADMTNMELVQDGLPRPRASLVPYGGDIVGDAYIGIGTFTKIVSGLPERWEISMQDDAGTGRLYVRKDGDTWTEVTGVTFDSTAWANFQQANNRVYISNGVDNMSYYNIDAGTITQGSVVATPSAPSPTKTGLTGTTYTLYYRVSANNAFGETAASTAGTVTVGALRDTFDATSNYVTITWGSVAGATSYNLYVGTASGSEYFLGTFNGLSYKDDGSISANIYRLAPAGDSTTGPILTFLWNSNGQLFGVGDVNNPSYLWYSGQGVDSGNFSPFSGGGYVGINYGGDTIPTNVRAFRDGKGNPVITVLSRGGGGGKLHHVSFLSTTIGDTLIVYPNVYEANGQDGTISPFGVVEANNALYYPTGEAFKSTGTKASQFNVLYTDDISQAIQPDVQDLNRSAMSSCVGLAYNGRIFWSVPTGSSAVNNEIWIKDLTRGGVWILRWTVGAKYMWLYEDNTGVVHHLVLTNDNEILEFTRSVATEDNGVAFRTRLASGAIVFDKSGQSMASIERIRFKLLFPKGTVSIRVYGLGEEDPLSLLADEEFTQTVSATGWGQMLWSDDSPISLYSDDPGEVDFYSVSVEPIEVEVDDILNEVRWEIISEGTGVDYTLSSVLTLGRSIPGLFYGD